MNRSNTQPIWSLKLGYSCNNDCIFCAVADLRSTQDRTTNEVKHELDLAIAHNSWKVTFIGGEPTIRPDIIEVIEYASEIGFEEIKISSNGRKLGDKNFAEQVFNAGSPVMWISVHAHKAEIGDYLSQRPGSFDETIAGIKNILDHDQHLSTNTIILKQNYRFLPEIVDFLADLGVSNARLGFVTAECNAYRNFYLVCPDMREVSPFVCNALDVGKERGLRMTVEAYPFCFIRGHEDCIPNLPYIESRETFRNITADELRRKIRQKGPQCKNCRYNDVCDGIDKKYLEFIPSMLYELQPIY